MTLRQGGNVRLWPAALVVAAAVCAMLAARACGVGVAGVTAVADRGAPRELRFDLLDGGSWQLSGERGHVVAVNLWATWCGPCREETPLLVKLGTELAPEGFRVVGISLDATGNREELVRQFRSAYGARYPIGFPPPLSQMEAGLDGIPTTLLFDREGRAAKVYVGEIPERSFRADIRSLLEEPQRQAR